MHSQAILYPSNCETISTGCQDAELIRRLKILSERLQNYGTSYEEIKKVEGFGDLLMHLAQPRFLRDRSSEIRLLIACSIADIFRINAPNPPIAHNPLIKRVMLFFTEILGNVYDKNDELNQHYVYLLENLSAVETMQMALRLGDDAHLILRRLVKTFANVNEKTADETAQAMMLGICSKLLVNVDEISNIVLDALFFFIVQPQKINNRESYRMARDLIRTNQTTLEPYVTSFLNQCIEMNVMTDCDMISPKKIFDLICELHKFVPEIIYSTLPCLLKQMQSEDAVTRREMVKLFGMLLSSENSRLAEDHPDVWAEYMKRFDDISPEIRCICARDAQSILIQHPGLRGQITDLLILRSQDIDENVRIEVISTVLSIAKRKLDALSERLLTRILERIRDKKVKVRLHAIRSLSQLHRTVFINDDHTNAERISVSSIFSALMNHYNEPLNEDRKLIEKVFTSNLLPYKMSAAKKADVLLTIFQFLNQFGIWALQQILAKYSRMLQNLRKIVAMCEDADESGKAEENMLKLIAKNEGDSKVCSSFKPFVRHLQSDSHLLTLVKYITQNDYSCTNVESTVMNVLHKLEDLKLPSGSLYAVRTFFERCAPLQFDHETIIELVDRITLDVKAGCDDIRCEKYFQLLLIIAESFPYCFKSVEVVSELSELFDLRDSSHDKCLLRIFITIAPQIREDSENFSDTKDKIVACCEKLVLSTEPKVAKYAIRCIAAILGTDEATPKLAKIVKTFIPHIDTSDDLCCTALKALTSCLEIATERFKEELFEVLKDKVMKILLKNGHENVASESGSGLFTSEELGRFIVIKGFCLNFIARFLIAVSNHADENVEAIARNLLTFLTTLLNSNDDVFDEAYSHTDMAHLRKVVGSCLLKVAASTRYYRIITPSDMACLSLLACDEDPAVRHNFIVKLNKHLMALRLPVEFMGFFALAGFVDDEVWRKKVRVLLNGNIAKRRMVLTMPEVKDNAAFYQPECCVAYAIYFLSKWPPYTSTSNVNALRKIRECIWMLLEVFNDRKEADCIEFINNIFKTIKLCVDADQTDRSQTKVDSQNKKLWALADIGILLLSYRIKVLVKDYPTKPLLKKKFFVYDPKKANTEVHVPNEIAEEMKTSKAPAHNVSSGSESGKDKKLAKNKPKKAGRLKKVNNNENHGPKKRTVTRKRDVVKVESQVNVKNPKQQLVESPERENIQLKVVTNPDGQSSGVVKKNIKKRSKHYTSGSDAAKKSKSSSKENIFDNSEVAGASLESCSHLSPIPFVDSKLAKRCSRLHQPFISSTPIVKHREPSKVNQGTKTGSRKCQVVVQPSGSGDTHTRPRKRMGIVEQPINESFEPEVKEGDCKGRANTKKKRPNKLKNTAPGQTQKMDAQPISSRLRSRKL